MPATIAAIIYRNVSREPISCLGFDAWEMTDVAAHRGFERLEVIDQLETVQRLQDCCPEMLTDASHKFSRYVRSPR